MPENPSFFSRDNHYANILQIGADGTVLATISEKRAKWYEKKGLATLEMKEKDGYKGFCYLNFKHKDGNPVDKRFILPTPNICVCCGRDNTQVKEQAGKLHRAGLTIHHIIPRFMIKNFPKYYKDSDRSYCVMLCWECHNRIENQLIDPISRPLVRFIEKSQLILKNFIITLWVLRHGGYGAVKRKYKAAFLKSNPKFLPVNYEKY